MATAAPSVEQVIRNTAAFVQTYFLVRNKRQRVVPFKLMPVQKHYYATKTRRTVILKSRQIGISTATLAWFLHNTITHQATTTSIIGHDTEAMQRLLDNGRLMLKGIPPGLRPHARYDNKGELSFDRLGSRLWIGTWRSQKARSGTVNNLLLTEVAFWESRRLEDLVGGFTESVPISGNIVIESTPNGIGGWFYRRVQSARRKESAYRLLEYPWYCDPEYRLPRKTWAIMHEAIRPADLEKPELDPEERKLVDGMGLDLEQVMWRRWKMHELGDMRVQEVRGRRKKKGRTVRVSRQLAQEYEIDFLHSGKQVFDPARLVPRCHWKGPVKGHRYLHGGDTAEGVEGGHYNVLETLDLDTGEFVAQIRTREKAYGFARRSHNRGMEYGGLIGIEANNTGTAVLNELAQLFIAATQELVPTADKKTGKQIMAPRGIDRMPYRIYGDRRRLGILSNQRLRKANILDFDKARADESLLLAYEDGVGLTELRQWEYNAAMKEGPPEGEYDDTVDAKRWAWEMRKYYAYFFDRDPGGIHARTISA